ncbi:MAG: caspase family protein [Bacteroidetes bacterium]|nr:caspase family protein [Bacteroidota bacterium]
MPDTPKKKIYALLVGMNDFENDRFNSLDGCINDVEAVHQFLKEQDGYELDVITLTSDNPEKLPTKSSIVHHFLTHLSKAGPNDVAFLFVASHGLQEKTDIKAFADIESGGLIESLVCYDSRFPLEENDYESFLADKELRWLVAQLNQESHILLIVDTCHSGDPRGGKPRFVNREKRSSLEDGQTRKTYRDYDKFIFGNPEFVEKYNKSVISRSQFNSGAVGELLPMGNHVYMGACLDEEVAFEGEYANGKSGGVFTIRLLKFLRNNGPSVSYDDLAEYLPLSMKDLPSTKSQHPVIHNFMADRGFTPFFMGGLSNSGKTKHKMVYKSGEGWAINLGSIHGLKKMRDGGKIKIYQDDPEAEPGFGSIYDIKPSYSIIDTGDLGLDLKKIYQVGIMAYLLDPLAVYVCGNSQVAPAVKAFLTQKNDNDEINYLNLVDSESTASYVVRANHSQLDITFPEDQKAIVEQIGGTNERSLDSLYNNLIHIAQWERIRNLTNPDSLLDKNPPPLPGIPQYPVEMKIHIAGDKGENEPIAYSDDKIPLSPVHRNKKGEPCCYVRIELINHSPYDLFIGLMYMSMLYGVDTSLIPTGIRLKGKQEGKDPDSIFVKDGLRIQISNYNHVLDFDWDNSTDHLKLIASRKKFSLQPFNMKELKPPVDSPRRALEVEEREDIVPDEDDWIARTYQITFPNPNLPG